MQATYQQDITLFQRALGDRDEAAWITLYASYRPMVLSWLLQSVAAKKIMSEDGDATSLVNAIFAKFARYITPNKLDTFDHIGKFIAYLKMITTSVVVDESRLRTQWRCEETLDGYEAMGEDTCDEVIGDIDSSHIWRVIRGVAHPDEWVLLSLNLAYGYTLAEIQEHRPDLFPTTKATYDTKRNVIARLRRNKALQALRHMEVSA